MEEEEPSNKAAEGIQEPNRKTNAEARGGAAAVVVVGFSSYRRDEKKAPSFFVNFVITPRWWLGGETYCVR